MTDNGKMMFMVKAIAEACFWVFLWVAIPAALLYPFAFWAAKHTLISVEAIWELYVFSVALLLFPTIFLVDFLYRRYLWDRTPKSERENSEIPN